MNLLPSEPRDLPPRRRGEKLLNRSKLLDPSNIILTISIVAALFFLITYSKANNELLRENENLKKITSKLLQPEAGDAVPPFESTDLEGRPVSVHYNSSRKHLFFIFTTTCRACVEQLPVWDRVAARVSSEDYLVHGVSLDTADQTKAHLDGRYQNLPIVLAPNENFMRTYRVNNFPQVMIVSGQGVVEWAHIGAILDTELQELLSNKNRVDAPKGR